MMLWMDDTVLYLQVKMGGATMRNFGIGRVWPVPVGADPVRNLPQVECVGTLALPGPYGAKGASG